MQERWFDVVGDGGVRLRAREVAGPSTGAPGLVLHHGLASTQRIWDLMLPTLTRHFRVVTYDARGHGLSGKPTSGYGFDHIREDAVAVIRAARLRRPVIAGHSWGAMAALDLAVERPRSVGAAVLIDGGVTAPGDRPPWDAFKEQLAPPMLAGTPVTRFRQGLRRWFPVPLTPQTEAVAMSLMRVDAHGAIHPRLSRANHFRILRAIWEQDPADLYRRLRVPTLAILAESGEEAWDGSKRAGVRAMQEARAPVRVAWIRGVHDLPLQHPAEVAARIRRFVGASG
jgi:pimeloyl-ACP methyl ester carboxylesterase